MPAPQSVAKHGGRADVGSTLYTLNDATRKEAIRPMMAVLDFAQPITYTLSLNVRATSQVESHWEGVASERAALGQKNSALGWIFWMLDCLKLCLADIIADKWKYEGNLEIQFTPTLP